MQFKIPRYIDYRAKILGPANFSQFIYLLVAGFLIGFLWLIINNIFVFIAVAILIAGLAVGLAFGKINSRPVPEMIAKYIQFKSKGKKVYFWNKKEITNNQTIKQTKQKKDDSDKIDTDKLKKKQKGKLDKISQKIEIS